MWLILVVEPLHLVLMCILIVSIWIVTSKPRAFAAMI
jgi:hypothetical protein